jgi:hypothetical protein
MNKVFPLIFLFGFVIGGSSLVFAEEFDAELRAIADNLKRNTHAVRNYGTTQRIVVTRLTSDGDVKRVEVKTLRTQWVQDKPKNVLIGVDCTDYDAHIRHSRQCMEFTREAAKQKTKASKFDSEIRKIRWVELYKNFEFRMLDKDGPYQVLSFRPKTTNTDTRNRMEKLLSHMTGKVWVDENLNIIKAEAHLASPVSFGLGLVAKVNSLSVQYHQQLYKGVWLPAYLNTEFSARIALVHTERQRIEVTWTDPFCRSDETQIQVEDKPGAQTSRER